MQGRSASRHLLLKNGKSTLTPDVRVGSAHFARAARQTAGAERVLQFGSEAEVLRPASLRRAVADDLRATIRRYRKASDR